MSRTDLPVGKGALVLLVTGICLAVTAGLLALPAILDFLGAGYSPTPLDSVMAVFRFFLAVVCLTSLGGAALTGLMIEHKRYRRDRP